MATFIYTKETESSTTTNIPVTKSTITNDIWAEASTSWIKTVTLYMRKATSATVKTNVQLYMIKGKYERYWKFATTYRTKRSCIQ